MNILQIHNHSIARGGEETMFRNITSLLNNNGHMTIKYDKDSRSINSLNKKISALISGIYSFRAYREVKHLIFNNDIDIVHLHNPYPLISYSIVDACKKLNVPVVIRSPNFRLICPTDKLWRNSNICKICLGGKEYNCIKVNCEGRFFHSVGYAMRHAFYYRRNYLDDIELIISPSNFVKEQLVESGIRDEKIGVIPNFVDLPDLSGKRNLGKYVGYAGRITSDKGVDTLLRSTEKLGIPLHIAGDNTQFNYKFDNIKHVKYLGHLEKPALNKFYSNARFIIVPSETLETFGLVAIEAMSHSVPVIASRIGGLKEVVDDGITGLLFESGNEFELSNKINYLWNNPQISQNMGSAGRSKAEKYYTEDVYYEKLIESYSNAINLYKAKSVSA